MNTPIADFLKEYSKSGFARFHMPGHKGRLGMSHDITEICGADDLYHASGIIAESEANATLLFGTRRTFYSTEGSSLCIRTMLFLALKASNKDNSSEEYKNHETKNSRPFILAGRNAHKTLLLTAALLDFDIEWLFSEAEENSLCDCTITEKGLKNKLNELALQGRKPFAVFITSPNYLGKIADIESLAKISHEANIPLLVDNAHGAYLKFLDNRKHPMELGADLCCDSAHKTLPALTGTAYLHVGKEALFPYEEHVKYAMSLFGSTSPSYLLLESLDCCNKILAEDFGPLLKKCVHNVEEIKAFLNAKGIKTEETETEGIETKGIKTEETEPLKIVINTSKMKMDGETFANALRAYKIEPEFADKDYVVLMVSPYNSSEDFEKLRSFAEEFSTRSYSSSANSDDKISITEALKEATATFEDNSSLTNKASLTKLPPKLLTPHEAVFADNEEIQVSDALGRICALPVVSCPPAIPIVAIGEEITEECIELLKIYGHDKIVVVK
ncbi:MAG: PLP-dependent transferase [Lachnospiraceae bacterium]|nr:PLP-dependent transferase [Lachnospiraceae bacterium]